MDFIDIPAGVLIMGDNRLSEASPQHQIQMGAFSIAKFPVTNQDFSGFIDAGGYRMEKYWTKMGWRAQSARPAAAPA